MSSPPLPEGHLIRGLCLLTIALLGLSAASTGIVAGNVVSNISDIDAQENETLEIDIRIENRSADSIAGFQYFIKYDPAVFEVNKFVGRDLPVDTTGIDNTEGWANHSGAEATNYNHPADPTIHAMNVTVVGNVGDETKIEFPSGDDLVNDENGNIAYLTPDAGSLSIVGECQSLDPVGGLSDPPNDLDDDGLCDDINNDTAFNLGDVIAFYDNFENDDTINNNPSFFDFNGDTDIDLGDVIELYEGV